MFRLLLALALSWQLSPVSGAADWPQFRGPNRDGVWSETSVLQDFPAEGLKIRWRNPVGAGHSSPIVAQGLVYLTDSETKQPKAWERVHCFDERTGETIWTFRDAINFPPSFDPNNPSGPCPTPFVDDNRIYALGATGHLLCLDARNGDEVWKKTLAKEYGLIEQPNLTPCPLIEGNLLIVVIGGKPGACVVAFDKHTGKEVWRALDDPPRAFSSPIVISAGGKRQLIVWTPSAVTSLDPSTGETWWRERLVTREDYAGATPVFQGDQLLISGLMLRLDHDKPAATVLWPKRKVLSQRIMSNTCMPSITGEQVYGADMNGRLLCLDANSGERLWENDKVTGDKKYGAIHLTPNGDSVLLFTDQGNLIRARLDKTGYEELSRVHLIEPTFLLNGRKVVWAPPAYANGHVFARNGKELICASLKVAP